MYYYAATDQANTNGSANTDTLIEDFRSIAGLRTQIRKIQLGVFAAPTDNNVRIQLRRATTVLQTSGTNTALIKNQADAPGAATLWQTGTITIGTGVLSTTGLVQLAYNMRGTAMWAAFIEDETISITGVAGALGEVAVVTQASVASVPVNITVMLSE